MFGAGEYENLMPTAFTNNMAKNIAFVRLVNHMHGLIDTLCSRITRCDGHFARVV
jgi:hypothetical protein